MKRLLSMAFLAYSAALCAQEQMTYPLKGKAPRSFEMYGDVAYYQSEKNIYNLQGCPLTTGKKIYDFKVDPAGASYALMVGKKNKRRVYLYDLWKQDKKLKKKKLKRMSSRPFAMAYTAHGNQLLVADGDARLYRFNNGKRAKALGAFKKFDQPPTSLAIDAAGQYLVAVYGRTAEIWNMEARDLSTATRKLEASANIVQVDISRDGTQMAVLTADGRLNIYNTASLVSMLSFDDLGQPVACSFHPEGTYIAVANGGNSIALLNTSNSQKRDYITAPEEGVTSLHFVQRKQDESVWLAYNTASQMVYANMNYLAPLRSQVMAERLQERMEAWEQRMPTETLEDYRMRVTPASRSEQMRLFEREIMAEMALEEYGQAEMKMGAYNSETGMLAVDLGEQFSDLYLDVPEEDLPAFMDTDNLEFRNMQYSLNDEDEFELLYADVFNKATGKTYTYDNTEGQFQDYAPQETDFTPLTLVQQSMEEKGSLADLREDVMTQAKGQQLISDHTQISVNTKIRPAVTADGRNVRNYEVGVTYTVDQEFSAREDYSGGRFRIEESNAGMAMLNIVKKALDQDFAKYVVAGKRLKVKISGAADASPIRKTIPYDGSYGDFQQQPIYLADVLTDITVTQATGINTNEQLAFLRAVGVKEYLMREAAALRKMDTEVEYHISVSKEKGSEHRKVSVELIFEDAFDNQ